MNSNFKKLVSGRLISNFGDSLYSISLSWLIIRVTKDPFWLGFLNAAVFAPNLFSFIFGKFIDTHSKRKILIFLEFGQLLSMIFLIAFLAIDYSNPLVISLIAFLAALFSMNTYTTQDSMIPNLVSTKDLEKTQSIMSSNYRAADILFNGISGFLTSIFKEWNLLIISAISFFSSMTIFAKMDSDEDKKDKRTENDFESPKIFDGFVTIFKSPILILFTVSGAVINFLFSGANIYVVLIANKLNNATVLGTFLGASAVGTLIGTMFMSRYVLKNFNIGKKLIIGYLGFGIFTGLSAPFSNSFWFIIPYTIASIFLGVTYTTQTPILQNEIDKNRLAQVLSAKYTVEVGIMPIGSLVFGEISKHYSSFNFYIVFGAVYVVTGIIYFLRKEIKNYIIN